MNHLKMHSLNKIDENVSKIAQLFPNCVTEAKDENGEITHKIDFDMLKQELSTSIVEGREERYQFTWPDKKQAILTANAPINKTLRPCREESVNFDDTENLYIEGDNLEVLKLLQETYLGKIKMIYIDPPYNTGRDFVYKDSFAVKTDEYNANSGQYDTNGNQLVANPESNGRFHTDWLNMMYVRLKIAKDLLADDGILFISIDDNEVDHLKMICTEIFGERNFVGCAGRITKKSNNKGDFWAPNFDYLLTYTKERNVAQSFTGGANIDAYNLIEEEGPRKGEKYQLVRLYMSSIQNRNPEQRFWIECPDGSHIIPPGTTFPPERPNLGDGIWRWTKKTFDENKDKIVVKEVKSSNLLNDEHKPAKWNVFTKTYLNDVLEKATAKPNSFIEEHINQIASHELNALDIPFDYAKPTSLMKYLMEIAQIKDDDIVLDFFSGSASTADSVLQYNSDKQITAKYIMVQIPDLIDEKSEAYQAGYRNICEIGKERIRRAGQQILKQVQSDKEKVTNELFAKDNKLVKTNSGGGTDSVPSSLDVGFRVLKVDSSNMQDVYYSPDDLHKQDLFQDNVKPDRTAEDLLFQVMLDLGVELSSKITTKEMNGKTVYYVNENYLVACFDQDLTEETITQIAKEKPYYFVMRDSVFANDSVATNFEQIFTTYSAETVRKVL